MLSGLVMFLSLEMKGQTLWGYSIQDHLVSAVHPDGCVQDHVVGPPDDKTWVNMSNYSEMTGLFQLGWMNGPGEDILLETSYHPDNYVVKLLLSTGIYSNPLQVSMGDWTLIDPIPWLHLFTSCDEGSQGNSRYILPLDFALGFGLQPQDVVIGIHIAFQPTGGAPDLAGVYIIAGESCVVDLGPDLALCTGEEVLLAVNATEGTYLWQDGSTASSFQVLGSGSYSVQYSSSTCVASDTINVVFNDPPIVSLGDDVILCEGDPLIFDVAQAGATYLWHDGSTGPTFIPIASGDHSVEVTVGGCSVTDSVIVVFEPAPVVDLGPDLSACEGETIVLDAANVGATYLWQDGTNEAALEVVSSGIHWVMVSTANCSTTDSVMILFDPLPTIDLGPDALLCAHEGGTLNAYYAGATYEWQDGSSTPEYLVDGTGAYWVTLTLNDCVATDTIHLEVIDCEIVLEMPDVFTPNADGYNDLFGPLAIKGIITGRMYIRNRWGQVVNEQDIAASGWNGRDISGYCPEGTYYYTIEYTDRLAQDGSRSGSFTLLR